jgi:hypothetical protein
MSPSFPDPPAAREESEARAALVEELERRIDEIEGLDETALGSFTTWDWVLCVVGGLVLPVFAIWWFA